MNRWCLTGLLGDGGPMPTDMRELWPLILAMTALGVFILWLLWKVVALVWFRNRKRLARAKRPPARRRSTGIRLLTSLWGLNLGAFGAFLGTSFFVDLNGRIAGLDERVSLAILIA